MKMRKFHKKSEINTFNCVNSPNPLVFQPAVNFTFYYSNLFKYTV